MYDWVRVTMAEADCFMGDCTNCTWFLQCVVQGVKQVGVELHQRIQAEDLQIMGSFAGRGDEAVDGGARLAHVLCHGCQVLPEAECWA